MILIQVMTAIALLCAGPTRSTVSLSECQIKLITCVQAGKSRWQEENLTQCVLNGATK
jgi:hypothetical protein